LILLAQASKKFKREGNMSNKADDGLNNQNDTDGIEPTEAAKALSSLGASKGGRARAAVLSSDERKAIAQKAVRTRWAKKKGISLEDQQVSDSLEQPAKTTEITSPVLPIAIFQGTLNIGDAEFTCYVLDNGKRVLAQREVVRLFTGHAQGNLGRYLEAHYLQEFINKDAIRKQTVKFSLPANRLVGDGYEALLILDICDAYLRARAEKKLHSRQVNLARQAEIITRACAKVGIIALIDEATGYQEFRKKQELQIKLQAFIAEEMQEWARMFPDEFWFELARLEGIHYSPRSRPLRWGKYIMMFVYDAIDGDVGKELRKKNPNPRFLQNHHQWLKQFGRNKVHDQIERVITIMKLCNNMDDFREKFAKVFKKTPLQMSFDDIGWGVEPVSLRDRRGPGKKP
jgi:hypothetical protein